MQTFGQQEQTCSSFSQFQPTIYQPNSPYILTLPPRLHRHPSTLSFRLHGTPTHIISDRDPVFTSTFWKELFKLANTTLCMSSAYHPQSDGQTERVNQCLETYLRCFIHSCPRQWLKWISLAEFWYNTSQHSSLGRLPFEVLYGHSPRHFGLSNESVSPVPDVASLMAEHATMWASVRQHLLRAQQHMKAQADKGRTERKFNVDDFVDLRLQPYVQSSLAPHAHQKLCFKFFGPFKIIDKIGEVAYKLLLPQGSTVHPVFHVSLLNPAPPPSSTSSAATMPPLRNFEDGLQVPERVLQRRLHPRDSNMVRQLLVKWSGFDDSLATWEDEDYIKQQFTAAPAWGHASSQGEGVSASLILVILKSVRSPGAASEGRPGLLSCPAQSGNVISVYVSPVSEGISDAVICKTNQL